MQRELDERLEKLKEQHIPIYSFSRLETINRCLYESYLTYVKGDRGENNIYALLGGKCHDTLEKIMNGEATEADLKNTVQEELDYLDIMGIEFPKDSKGGDSIREGWIANMTHFCETYKAPNGKFETETLFLYQTPKGRWLQGYIDLTKINNDGSISIYDYKTSSMYTAAGLVEHGRQLVTYALGKMQEGYTVKEIAWIMLKYVDVKFTGKKTAKSKTETEIVKTIERRKIGKELSSYVESMLAAQGYDEVDIEYYLHNFEEQNRLEVLPKEVADRFTITPCVLKWKLDDKTLRECEEYIDRTIDKWEKLDANDESAYTPRSFTRINKFGKEVDDYFFCSNLCGHSKECPFLHEFFDKRAAASNDEDDDLF